MIPNNLTNKVHNKDNVGFKTLRKGTDIKKTQYLDGYSFLLD